MKQMTTMMNAFFGMMRRSVAIKNNEMVFANELSADTKAFLQENFPNQAVAYAEKKGNMLEVSLNDGTEVTFSKDGTWGKVSRNQESLPASLLPASITNNVKTLFNDALVVCADKTKQAYCVMLSNGISLKYSMDGHLA